MINKVSFTGREGMLVKPFVKPVEQEVVKASTYIEKALPKAEEASKSVVEPIYSSPFAPINNIEALYAKNVGKFLNYVI